MYPESCSKTSFVIVSYIGLGLYKSSPFRLGIIFFNGLSSSFFSRSFQEIFEKNACDFISSHPIRCSGSLRRHFLMKSYAESSKSAVNTGLFSRIFAIIPIQLRLLSVKGGVPLINSKTNTPKAQISHFNP